jgi:hypothetical protein
MRRVALRTVFQMFLSIAVACSWAGAARAASPVLLGDQSINSNADSVAPGQAEAFPFVAGSSGITDSVSLYIDSQTGASTALVGIYADANGQPGSLLAHGGTSSPAAGTWNSITVDSASVVAGDTYWITVLAQGGSLFFRDSSTGTCSSITSSQTNLSSLPGLWTSGSRWPTCSLSAYVTGAPATPPPPPAPSNTAPPTISGTPQQGDVLTTSDGSWTNSPTGFTYQWRSCDSSGLLCSDISGASSSSYTLTGADVGRTVVSVVTASNAGGSNSQASPPTTVVAAPRQSTSSIWPASAVPSTITEPDPDAVELGLKFQSAVPTTVTGVRFYKSPTNTGTHSGSLWSSTGQLLATVTFTNESASGWQQAAFPTPVPIAANTTYVVSYHTNVGYYSADTHYFDTQGVTNGTLTALSDAAAGGNGVFAYGSSAFPSQNYEASNYWVDVLTASPGPPDTTPPTVPTNLTATANGSTQVDLNWTPSTDNTGVTGYNVYRDGTKIATTSATTYSDTTVSAATTYTYTVDAYDAAGNTSAQTAAVTVTLPTGGTTIFSDHFSGTSLSPAWTVISRHGEYAQNETECNVPQEVTVANSMLDIATVAQNTTCGDFNLDGSVRHAPSAWPYATGDVQWSTFNFTFGTVTYRAKFPPSDTGTWPAIWLLGSNCQATNPMTADVGYSTCPPLETPGYTETDMTECDTRNWCQLATAQPSSFPVCGYPVDNNWHTFSLTWTPAAIAMSIDGQPTGCSFTKAAGYAIPSTPMFLIIQTQTGGVGGTPNDANLPAHLDVSSVTVTQP